MHKKRQEVVNLYHSEIRRYQKTKVPPSFGYKTAVLQQRYGKYSNYNRCMDYCKDVDAPKDALRHVLEHVLCLLSPEACAVEVQLLLLLVLLGEVHPVTHRTDRLQGNAFAHSAKCGENASEPLVSVGNGVWNYVVPPCRVAPIEYRNIRIEKIF